MEFITVVEMKIGYNCGIFTFRYASEALDFMTIANMAHVPGEDDVKIKMYQTKVEDETEENEKDGEEE